MVGRPRQARVTAIERQRRRAPRERRGEQETHRPPLGRPEEAGALGPGSIHDGADIVHPVFERRDRYVAIGETGATLVEANEPSERREPFEETNRVGVFPRVLEVRQKSGYVDDVDRTTANDLIRDANVAAQGVLRLGPHASTGTCWLNTLAIFRQPSIRRNVICSCVFTSYESL